MTPEERARFWTPELIAERDRIVATAPPLTDEQRATLRALFAPVRRPVGQERRAS